MDIRLLLGGLVAVYGLLWAAMFGISNVAPLNEFVFDNTVLLTGIATVIAWYPIVAISYFYRQQTSQTRWTTITATSAILTLASFALTLNVWLPDGPKGYDGFIVFMIGFGVLAASVVLIAFASAGKVQGRTLRQAGKVLFACIAVTALFGLLAINNVASQMLFPVFGICSMLAQIRALVCLGMAATSGRRGGALD